MTSSQIRQSFLDFFRSKEHTIVSSASLMPTSPNLLFTNAGMNQFVPIFLDEVPCPYTPGRAADTQKCIRAGGKHNDLDDVGWDTYHHTFFEMLGNWSFGGYFKKEAIEWAWELVVERWGFPPERLYATVYAPAEGDPAEFDQEAYDFWETKFRSVGLDPAVHIVNGNKKDNFWMMGETGPCGPCSELHVDLTPDGDTRGGLVNAGDSRCIEIWNLVFIQFTANQDGTFSPLPAKHVDTGMGFERVTSILQGTKNFTDFSRPISNYETDVFRPVFDAIEKLSGHRYGATLPVVIGKAASEQEERDVAFRVIGDHLRTLSFSTADGISPGNNDRNYVLRRILRRAVLYGRSLGFDKPFLTHLVPTLVDAMGEVFPELQREQSHIAEVLEREEAAFLRTLDKGVQTFNAEADRILAAGGGETVSGAFAFRLYDEQGFPLDLTEIMARERGLGVDTAGFEVLMEEQRDRARKARKTEVITVSDIATKQATEFVGFETLEAEASVLEVVQIKDDLALITDVSPCYAEMGGQVGDTGVALSGSGAWGIASTRKTGETWLHILGATDDAPEPSTKLTLQVDRNRRQAIERHHTVTHLLHWALHEVVDSKATQKGSSVTPAKLTFDFNSGALTPSQVRDIEKLVNERILANATVSWTEVPYADVAGRGDIMQFFGDKYGDRVRVVQIGGEAGSLNGYSMELCGGTHTRATGEIGLFRIVSESAVAAGIRRIEAVAGLEAYNDALAGRHSLADMAKTLGCPIAEIPKKLETVLAKTKSLEAEMKALKTSQAAVTANELLASAELIGGTPAIIANLPATGAETLQAVLDALKGRFEGVVFLAATDAPGSVALGAMVSAAHLQKVQAGKLISNAAPAVGGKGGGRPEMARGAGNQPENIPGVLEQVRSALAGK